MAVILRKSKLTKGYSFYFDISYNGKRWTEWTKIRVKHSDPVEEKNEKIRLAKQMRSERDRELIVLGKNLPGEVTVRPTDFFNVYDEMVAKRTTAKHIYENIRKKLKTFYGEKPLPILSIDKPWLTRFLNFLNKEELSHSSIRQYFGFVGTVLKEAMCAGYITHNPHALFTKHEKPPQKRNIAEYLTPDEFDSFLHTQTKRVDGQLKEMFFFSCFTGLRWSDCQRIKWDFIKWIKLEGEMKQVIIMNQQKTSRQVVIPLTSSALSLLEMLKNEMRKNDEPKSEYIFHRWSIQVEENISIPLRAKMANHMRSWAKQVGFTRRFKFHMARHTYATWLIQNGVDLYTVSKLLGHADLSATTIYAHVTDQLKMQAACKLPFIDVRKPKHVQMTKVA